MKKSILILIITVVFGSSSVLADTPEANEPKTPKAMVVQINKMLGEQPIPDEIRGSKAEVRIAVDTGNYLRILSIETDNEALDKFIRTSIDFKKLSKGKYQQGIVYRIPLEVRE